MNLWWCTSAVIPLRALRLACHFSIGGVTWGPFSATLVTPPNTLPHTKRGSQHVQEWSGCRCSLWILHMKPCRRAREVAQHVPGTRRRWAQAVERGASRSCASWIIRGAFSHNLRYRGLEGEHTRSAPATTRDSGHSVTSCTDVGIAAAAAELQLRLLHAPRPKQERRTDRTSRDVDRIRCSFAHW